VKNVIVIGAGIAGLASAIRMAVKGYSVTVFEANSYPGGKLSELQLDGFRFDAGPSLFTVPELVTELFTLAGKNHKEYFSYQKLETICHYFFNDGSRLNASANKEKFVDDAHKITGIDKLKLVEHLTKSEFIYNRTAHLFLEKSLHKFKSYLNFKTIQSIAALPFLGITTSMHKANKKALKNTKMNQLFNRYATYNGSNPYDCPAVLNIIPHLEFSKGAYYPDGGMISITYALYTLAQEVGVTFKFNTKVEKIITENGMAKGIIAKQEKYLADVVVCNMDVAFAYKQLLQDTSATHKILKQERSSSALIFYWGINRAFPELNLHNIFFSDDYEQEFEYIFKHKKCYNDPTVYINITSKYSKEDAPEGMENWFVMINVPHIDNQNWDELINAARKNIIQKINKTLDVDIEKHIVCEELLEPRTIESKTSSYKGSLYGTSSNSRMAAFFRHPNFSKEYKNLFFVGGSVHPGGGIPLALSSAKIVDGLIKNTTA
jgi:phytoene desaturase